MTEEIIKDICACIMTIAFLIFVYKMCFGDK